MCTRLVASHGREERPRGVSVKSTGGAHNHSRAAFGDQRREVTAATRPALALAEAEHRHVTDAAFAVSRVGGAEVGAPVWEAEGGVLVRKLPQAAKEPTVCGSLLVERADVGRDRCVDGVGLAGGSFNRLARTAPPQGCARGFR